MAKTKSYSALRKQENRLLDRIDMEANAKVKAIQDEIWRRKATVRGTNPEEAARYNAWVRERQAEQRAIRDKAQADQARVFRASINVGRNMEKAGNARSEETRRRFLEKGGRFENVRFSAKERQTGSAASAALSVG